MYYIFFGWIWWQKYEQHKVTETYHVTNMSKNIKTVNLIAYTWIVVQTGYFNIKKCNKYP